MSKNSRLDFSPVTRFRNRFVRSDSRRLMLGLTTRQVRSDQPSMLQPITEYSVSGLRRTASILDRLQSPVTRFRD